MPSSVSAAQRARTPETARPEQLSGFRISSFIGISRTAGFVQHLLGLLFASILKTGWRPCLPQQYHSTGCSCARCLCCGLKPVAHGSVRLRAQKPQTLNNCFYFPFHSPNMTPIYYSSFHCIFHYPHIVPIYPPQCITLDPKP